MIRSQSVGNELNKINTPNKRTPVFGSIERGLDKVKTIFTPRKRLNSLETPRKAKVFFLNQFLQIYNNHSNFKKDTCNITITNTMNADIIIEELVNVVSSKHLYYTKEKGYFC
jgi:hypothetical protein